MIAYVKLLSSSGEELLQRVYSPDDATPFNSKKQALPYWERAFHELGKDLDWQIEERPDGSCIIKAPRGREAF